MSVRLFFILIEISGDPFKSNGAHILVRTHSPRDTGKIFQFYFLAYLTRCFIVACYIRTIVTPAIGKSIYELEQSVKKIDRLLGQIRIKGRQQYLETNPE